MIGRTNACSSGGGITLAPVSKFTLFDIEIPEELPSGKTVVFAYPSPYTGTESAAITVYSATLTQYVCQAATSVNYQLWAAGDTCTVSGGKTTFHLNIGLRQQTGTPLYAIV